jgi:hypothetical protein
MASFSRSTFLKEKVFHRASIRKYSEIHQRASKIWYNMNRFMDFIPIRPDVMKLRPLRIFESKFQRKSRKQPKNKIHPANGLFDGVVKPLVRDVVEND